MVLLKKKRGFSIGEVMISLFVIVVGILASFNLLSRSIGESIDSRNQVIAAGLCQEGIELVRNVRDNNYAAGESFVDDFPNPAEGLNHDDCRVKKEAVIECGSGIDYDLYYDSSGFYTHTSASQTNFRRKIIFEYDSDPPSQAAVKSVVIWGNDWPTSDLSDCATAKKCVMMEAVLFDNY